MASVRDDIREIFRRLADIARDLRNLSLTSAELPVFESYDAAGGSIISESPAAASFGTVRQNRGGEMTQIAGGASVATGGLYRITAKLTAGSSTADAFDVPAWIAVNGTEAPGTRGYLGDA